MNKKTALIQALVTSLAALAAGSESLAAPPCWKAEGFPNSAAFEKQKSNWQAEAVPAPAPWNMLTAYTIFKHERAFALSRFKSDKQVHCYMGCRIAQDANFHTAQWAGWKKEDKDINDCNGNTHFEIMDYQVTVVGAHYGAASNRQEACVASCDQPFPPR